MTLHIFAAPEPDPEFIPIYKLVERITMRACWQCIVRAVAPGAPNWLLGGLVQVLVRDDASPDALLLVSDALTEAARIAEIEGDTAMSRRLRDLAELPREMVSIRSRREA